MIATHLITCLTLESKAYNKTLSYSLIVYMSISIQYVCFPHARLSFNRVGALKLTLETLHPQMWWLLCLRVCVCVCLCHTFHFCHLAGGRSLIIHPSPTLYTPAGNLPSAHSISTPVLQAIIAGSLFHSLKSVPCRWPLLASRLFGHCVPLLLLTISSLCTDCRPSCYRTLVCPTTHLPSSPSPHSQPLLICCPQ